MLHSLLVSFLAIAAQKRFAHLTSRSPCDPMTRFHLSWFSSKLIVSVSSFTKAVIGFDVVVLPLQLAVKVDTEAAELSH